MQGFELNVDKRDGSVSARQLRRQGEIPGVFYGSGGGSVPLKVSAREFSRAGLRGHGATIISFTSSDESLDRGLAMVKEVQIHPVTGAPIHLDFVRVDEATPVNARVSLLYTGKAAGVIEGGMLQPIRRDLEIRALPRNLPVHIEVDVSDLNIHDSMHVEELKLPEGVEAVISENFTLVTVVPPVVQPVTAEEEDVDVAVAAGDEAASSGAEGESTEAES